MNYYIYLDPQLRVRKRNSQFGRAQRGGNKKLSLSPRSGRLAGAPGYALF
jgi:hypothetical protein